MAEFGREEGNHDDQSDAKRHEPALKGWGLTPQIREPRCTICQSPYRNHIDRMVVSGHSIAQVAAYFEAIGEVFSQSSLKRHRKRHMTLHQAGVRQIIERRAVEIAENVDEHAGFLATKRGILETAMQKGFDSILEGRVEVEPVVLLQIMEKLQQMEAEERKVAIDEMQRDFAAFAAAVKAYITDEEQWREIFALYQANLDRDKVPVLENLVQIEAAEEDIDPDDISLEDDDD